MKNSKFNNITQVTPTYIPINDCGERDREVIITIRPHLPIRVKPVKIDIVSPTTKLIDEICVVGDKEGFQDCGIVFETGHRVGRPIRFKLMTNCGTGDQSKTLAATYQLQHSFFDLNINRFWVNHQFPTIKVGYCALISLVTVEKKRSNVFKRFASLLKVDKPGNIVSCHVS